MTCWRIVPLVVRAMFVIYSMVIGGSVTRSLMVSIAQLDIAQLDDERPRGRYLGFDDPFRG